MSAGGAEPAGAARGEAPARAAHEPERLRLFVAVFPPAATQALAASVGESLRTPNDGVSWVKGANLHYTLRFVGHVGQDGARRVREAAGEAARAHAPFGLKLGPPGAFPTARQARVIWLGTLEGAEPFAQLATTLERGLARRGFAPEGRPFTPHLTLGRVRTPGRDWTEALIRARPVDHEAAARFGVEELCVVRSTLSPRGSRYEMLEVARLGE